MPRIAEIVTLPDGRPAVVLELVGDEGSLTIWSAAEVEACKRAAAALEREDCAKIADDEQEYYDSRCYDGICELGSRISDAIRNRTNI